MSRDCIMKDMIKEKLIDEEIELFDHEGTLCVQKETEKCKEIVSFLRDKYGPIATLGYNVVIHNSGTAAIRSQEGTMGHLATVENAVAKNPNAQYDAYEYMGTDRNGLPQYEVVDVEKNVGYTRGAAQKVQAAQRKQNRAKKSQKIRNKKDEFGMVQPNFKQKNYAAEKETEQFRNTAVCMVQGDQVPDHEMIPPREAITIDYTRKNRHVRRALKTKAKTMNPISAMNLKARTQAQFRRDYCKDLMRSKQRQWQSSRTGRLIKQQTNRSAEVVNWKHRADPIKVSQGKQKTAQMWASATFD